MKVGTDGVLLGAWVPIKDAKYILDIGTGTGLIALMLAQRAENTFVDAIEIEPQAFEQASANFNESPWIKRLNAVHTDFKSFDSSKKYDLIVSNPPYFNNAVKNNCEQKSQARHTDSLSFDELLKGTVRLLSDNGRFCVILPADEKSFFETLAHKNTLFLNAVLNIKPTPSKPIKRVLLEFSLIETSIKEETMIIEEFGRHQYSEAYKLLTKEFYLAF